MKAINKFSATLLTASLALGAAAHASASDDTVLRQGWSGSSAVGGTDHYSLQLQAPARVIVKSHSIVPLYSGSLNIRGRLVDENNNVVASIPHWSSAFTIDRQLQPGRYTLLVDSRNITMEKSGPNRYLLNTRIVAGR